MILNTIEKKNILVVGDVMLDIFCTGEVRRISPEAPVPVFLKKSERSVPGGAANAAANLAAAGQNVSVMAVTGNDAGGEKLKSILAGLGIRTDLLIATDRKTTEKTRFLTAGNQQVMRLDVEDTDPLGDAECKELLDALSARPDQFDLILLSDYLKGLLTYDLTQGILQLAKSRNIPAVIDIKDPETSKYRDAFLIKCNRKELQEITGRTVQTEDEIIEASEYLRKQCGSRYGLVTCGAGGMILTGDDRPYRVPSAGREVFDVTGAGDTAIAYLAACMANGFSMKESVDIANCAAGIQVSKAGTSSVSWDEIRECPAGQKEGHSCKLISGKEVDDFRRENAGKKVVFTNGCFDILHTGHVRCLQEAAKLGDLLVVGLNSDASVKRLKGKERPVNSEQERAELLCAFGFVDYVVIFDEDTPLELIKKLRPDVLVKGGDYSGQYVAGADEVEAGGGKLVLLPYVEGKSTTDIINRIRE